MAISRSEGNNDFLASKMQSSSAWLGLNDEVTEGSFVWSVNVSINEYHNWNDGHPKQNNSGENADYVEIEQSTGKWNNIYGNESIGNICAKPGKESFMYVCLLRCLYSWGITSSSPFISQSYLKSDPDGYF